MSNPQQPPGATGVSGTVLVVGIVAVFVTTITACTLIALAVEDGARATSLIGLLLGSVASVIVSLGTLATVVGLKRTVDGVATQTTDLTNGLLDAKVRAAFADVARPDLLHEDAGEQLARDRVRRDQASGKLEAP